MSKQIFVEAIIDENGQEMTYVDWNKEVTPIMAIVVLQNAIGAISQQVQKLMALNTQGQVHRPDFVTRPSK